MSVMLKKCAVVLTASTIISLMAGCSLSGGDSAVSSENDSTQNNARYISTTKTARYAIDNNAEDEDLSGYKTTAKDTETGSLENPLSDDPDPDILATMTTTWYTTPSSTKAKEKKKTSKKAVTSATSFVADKLHYPEDSEKFKAKKAYKVTSDTTYLNLRFGPSKDYKVQLKIPDGKIIYGMAKTKDKSGNYWIFVSYNGKNGWVMEELLKAN